MSTRFACAAIGCWLVGVPVAQVPTPPLPPGTGGPADERHGLDDGPTAYARLLEKVGGWQREHHDLVRRVEIGTSVQGRPLFVLRIGARDDGAPEVYVGAAIHGGEGSELDAIAMVDELLERATEPTVARLLAGRVLWVQPVVNPDGLVARQRKNANGVDLNRNFAARWQPGRGPESRDHPGSAPFSEPETRALREFLEPRLHLRAYLDLHRSVDALIPAQRGPDGVVDDVVASAGAALNAATGNYSRVNEGRLLHFPTMHGLSVDWVWAELGVVAFTMETAWRGATAAAHDPRWPALLHLLERAADQTPGRNEVAALHYPVLVTEDTRRDEGELARLTRPGTVLFADDFESDASLASYFEVGGQREGRVRIVHDPALVHGGTGALQLTSTDSGGRSCGSSAVLWLGDEGHDCVHLRCWMRYADDYDQGNLHHTGGSLAGVAGTDKWAGMGTAGLRPAGDDHFSTRVEGWRDWQRLPAPGALHCYTYWMDMRRDRDGHYWGNLLGPAAAEAFVPARGAWHCVEQRVAVNAPDRADGELAVWIDGHLYLHYRGFRWRSSEAVHIKRATLMVYVHEARRDNRVCYDDLVVSTGYIGTGAGAGERVK
ncbi:MAG TPA: M14 family metallopeptidase [Planctomycetota bacterium]|nr:M14 family metallopeptidase [Planctomycetota bacterium]